MRRISHFLAGSARVIPARRAGTTISSRHISRFAFKGAIGGAQGKSAVDRIDYQGRIGLRFFTRARNSVRRAVMNSPEPGVFARKFLENGPACLEPSADEYQAELDQMVERCGSDIPLAGNNDSSGGTPNNPDTGPSGDPFGRGFGGWNTHMATPGPKLITNEGLNNFDAVQSNDSSSKWDSNPAFWG
jgi:hypothetical protein